MNFPAELKYSRDHEWVKMLDDTTALVGISDFAQSGLGDLVYVNLPVAGDDVVKDVDEAAVAGDDLVGTLTKERSRGRCLEISRPPPCRVEECGRSHGDTARHTTVARRTRQEAFIRYKVS